MSDIYCPPPDPSDYLDKEIVYPDLEGKEQKKSTDLTHNDINFDDSKTGKSQINLEDDLAKVRAKKLQARIQSESYIRSSKSQTVLGAISDRPIKSGRFIYSIQANILKKVVNEI